MKSLNSLAKKDLQDETCLLRLGLDIQDPKDKFNLRIDSILPTIKFLSRKKSKIVILSHRGRPDPKSKKDREYFSFKSFIPVLQNKIGKKIRFVDFYQKGNIFPVGKIIKIVASAPRGSILFLENLRFLPGEKKNDKGLAKELSSLGSFYVNDAFSVCHRSDSSIDAIVDFLPSFAGFLLEEELKNLDRVLEKYQRPLVILLGGAKISDKIGLMKNFYNKADYFLTGGGIANTLFALKGFPVGNSLYENIKINPIILSGVNKKIILPVDLVIEDRKILDVGKETISHYAQIIKKARTIIWNGPFGLIEEKQFRKGTEAIAKAIFESKAFSVIGGGETASVFKYRKPNIFVSTGGGAMLDYLSGMKLPGIEALKRNKLTLKK